MSPKCFLKCGFDLEQATVICCVVEFFFAYVHVLVATFVVLLAPLKYIAILGHECYNFDPKVLPTNEQEAKVYQDCRKYENKEFYPALGPMQWLFFATYLIYLIGLYAQAAFSIPLYHIGYKKRNPLIITIWIVIAAINYLCPAVLFFGSFAGQDLGGAYSLKEFAKLEPKDMKGVNAWKFEDGGIPKLTGFIFFYEFYLDVGFAVFLAFRSSLMRGGRTIAPAFVPEQAMETPEMKPEASEVQVLSPELAGETPSVENV